MPSLPANTLLVALTTRKIMNPLLDESPVFPTCIGVVDISLVRNQTGYNTAQKKQHSDGRKTDSNESEPEVHAIYHGQHFGVSLRNPPKVCVIINIIILIIIFSLIVAAAVFYMKLQVLCYYFN